MLDNGDMVMVFKDALINIPIMRVGWQGEVIWAKLFLLKINDFPCETLYYKHGGDLIFKIDTCLFNSSCVTVISKMDINGTFLSRYNLSTKMNKIIDQINYSLLNLEVSRNGNCIFGGPDGPVDIVFENSWSITYSGVYSSVIRTDEFLNTVWYSTFQIGSSTLNIIFPMIDEDNDEVFILTLNIDSFVCLVSLNYSSGIYKRSQCYTFEQAETLIYDSSVLLDISFYPFNKDSIILTNNDLKTMNYEIMITSKATLKINKIYQQSSERRFYYLNSYPIQNSKKYRLFLVRNFEFLVVDYNLESISLENISVYKRNYTDNYNKLRQIEMFVYNPLNSSDCSTDLSCYINYIANEVYLYDFINNPPKIYFDHFNFNINGLYCDPIYNINEFESDFDTSTLFIELTDFTELFGYLDYDFQFNVSKLSVNDITDYNITLTNLNLNNEIWPSFHPEFYGQCKFDMPEFVLNSKQFTFKIGKSINYEDNSSQVTTYYPFSHCRSTRFYLIACASKDSITNGNCTMLDWIAIDNEVNSFSVLLNQITSIGSKTLVLQAIIQEPFQIIDYSMFSSDKYLLSFEFTNENVHVYQFSSDAYVIINQLKNFTINFVDVEEDYILLNIKNYGSLYAHTERYQSDNNIFILTVLANQGVNTQTSIILNYTDSYHQDLQYWNYLTMNVFIFESNPPQYAVPLQNVSISACGCANFSLPTAIDQDGDSFNVNLNNSASDWIKLIDMNTLFVCPPQSSIYKNMLAQLVNIVLLDVTGAYSNNTFYVNIDTSMLVEFPIIQNISMHYLELYSMKLDVQSANNIHLVDCFSLQTITWSSYNSISKLLNINGNNIDLLGTHCVNVQAIDGCNNSIISNSFKILVNLKKPPVFLKTIPPITLMKGQNKITEYDKQMIFNDNSKELNYSLYFLPNFNSQGYPNTLLTLHENMFYILVEGTIDGIFTAIFSVTDIYNQTAETTVSITVYKCASKDCAKCTGIYQKDCTQCVDRYVLDDQTKTCYFENKYLPKGSSFFVFIGFAIFISILINICFISKLKRLSLLSIKYIQVILIFLLSTNNIEPETLDLTALLVTFNLNFDYLSPSVLNSWLSCHNESQTMQNLHFYCTSTLTNYKCAILVLLLIVFVYFVSKVLISKIKWISSLIDFLKSLNCLCFITKIEITRYDVVWIVYNLIFPIMMISLLSDLINFKSRLVLNFTNLFIIFAFIILCLFTKLKFIMPEFIVKIDPTNPFIYSYADFIRNCVHCCLFVLGNDTNYEMWIWIAFCVNVILLYIQSSRFIRKKCECKLNMNQIKEMPLHFYGESFTLFILGIITVNRVFSSVSNQLSVKSTLKSVSCLILLLFISILLTSLIALKNREDPKLEANENK